MSFLESLVISVFGISIVFVVLIALSGCITVASKLIALLNKDKDSVETQEPDPASNVDVPPISAGELKLIDVDEKTAAMIMAIVSHESGIPLSELQFKSIKALD